MANVSSAAGAGAGAASIVSCTGAGGVRVQNALAHEAVRRKRKLLGHGGYRRVIVSRRTRGFLVVLGREVQGGIVGGRRLGRLETVAGRRRGIARKALCVCEHTVVVEGA